MISRKIRVIFGILFMIGMISVLGIGLQASIAQKPDLQVNPNQQVSVDDKIINTITVKLEDGISSSDEIN